MKTANQSELAKMITNKMIAGNFFNMELTTRFNSQR